MIIAAERQDEAGHMPFANHPIELTAGLASALLSARPSRPRDDRIESALLGHLIAGLEDGATAVHHGIVAALVKLCQAGSAGLDRLDPNDGGEVIHIVAAAGRLAELGGRHLPRDEWLSSFCLASNDILLHTPATNSRFGAAVPGPDVIEMLTVPVRAANGQPIAAIWLAAHQDDRPLDAEDLRLLTVVARQLGRVLAQLEWRSEHELMLQELRHRSINDLQMIASLISLQRLRMEDTAALPIFDDVVTRIQTIARVRTTTMAGTTADLSVALREICLASAAKTSLHDIRLTIDMADEIQSMHPDQVLILALIVNELITNAIKHAFTKGRSGSIEVTSWRIQPNDVVIRVRDDGAPFEADLTALRRKSLGFTLIERLAARIQGRIIYPPRDSKDLIVRAPITSAHRSSV